jgi:FkbM family methyltransferase
MTEFSLFDLRPDLPPIEILDVGALEDPIWPPPYKRLVTAGRARLTGFEPNFEACLRLRLAYGSPHRFYPVFVGSGEPGTYYATNRIQTGSLYEPNTPLLELFNSLAEVSVVTATQTVRTARLDDLTDLDDVDYVKIDVQGSELAALQGAVKLLESVVLIQTEVAFEAFYRDQPLFGDVDGFLRSQGFWLHLFPGLDAVTMKPFARGGKQVLWTDVVYTRHPLRLGALPELKLWKLAAVLHDVYGATDFAHACLRTIDARTGGAVADAYRARVAAEPAPSA